MCKSDVSRITLNSENTKVISIAVDVSCFFRTLIIIVAVIKITIGGNLDM